MGSFRLESLILKSLKIPKGGNQNPYIEEQQTTQWPKEKVQKTIYKTEMEFDVIILYLGVKMCKFYVCTICKQDISQVILIKLCILIEKKALLKDSTTSPQCMQ